MHRQGQSKSNYSARRVYAQPRQCLAWRNVPAKEVTPPCYTYGSNTGPQLKPGYDGCVMTTKTNITQYGQQVGKTFYEADYRDGTGAQADFSDQAAADTSIHRDGSCNVSAYSNWCR